MLNSQMSSMNVFIVISKLWINSQISHMYVSPSQRGAWGWIAKCLTYTYWTSFQRERKQPNISHVRIANHLKYMDKQPNVSHVCIEKHLKERPEGEKQNVSHVRIEHHFKEGVNSQMSHMYVLNIILKVSINSQMSHMYVLNIISKVWINSQMSHIYVLNNISKRGLRVKSKMSHMYVLNIISKRA